MFLGRFSVFFRLFAGSMRLIFIWSRTLFMSVPRRLMSLISSVIVRSKLNIFSFFLIFFFIISFGFILYFLKLFLFYSFFLHVSSFFSANICFLHSRTFWWIRWISVICKSQQSWDKWGTKIEPWISHFITNNLEYKLFWLKYWHFFVSILLMIFVLKTKGYNEALQWKM